MNTKEVKGNWKEQKGKLNQKFAGLTDNDQKFAKGKKDEMPGSCKSDLIKQKKNFMRLCLLIN
ncbi:MAG: general stress protein CsbD [Bacteroidota bacterium]